MTQDINTLFAQLEEIKDLPIEEQEKWVDENVRPFMEWVNSSIAMFAEVAIAIQEAFAPIAQWAKDNEELIEKYRVLFGDSEESGDSEYYDPDDIWDYDEDEYRECECGCGADYRECEGDGE